MNHTQYNGTPAAAGNFSPAQMLAEMEVWNISEHVEVKGTAERRRNVL